MFCRSGSSTSTFLLAVFLCVGHWCDIQQHSRCAWVDTEPAQFIRGYDGSNRRERNTSDWVVFWGTRGGLSAMHCWMLMVFIIVPRSASGITFIRRVCITAVNTVSNVADDDANSYIYYTFITLHYTVHISLFSYISTLHALRSLSLSLLSPHFRGFRSVHLQPISSLFWCAKVVEIGAYGQDEGEC